MTTENVQVEEEIQRMEDEGGPVNDVPPPVRPPGDRESDEPTNDVPPDPSPDSDKPQLEEMKGPPVMVGPHALGGIQLIARDVAGNVVQTRMDLNEAAIVLVHMNALMTMMFQAMYHQAAAQEQSAREIYVPRG